MKTTLYILLLCIGLNACAVTPVHQDLTETCAYPSGDNPTRKWNTANLTHYTSYPEEGSEECIKYNGCKWAGRFSALARKQSREWVKNHNIIAVHSKDYEALKLKRLLLRQGKKTIVAKVYDLCSDADCNGCCTKNLAPHNYLIDIEQHTMERFGTNQGTVEWITCSE